MPKFKVYASLAKEKTVVSAWSGEELHITPKETIFTVLSDGRTLYMKNVDHQFAQRICFIYHIEEVLKSRFIKDIESHEKDNKLDAFDRYTVSEDVATPTPLEKSNEQYADYVKLSMEALAVWLGS